MTAMEKAVKIEPRCVFAGGAPLPNVRVLLVYEDTVKVVVIVDCREFYAFAYKGDAKEFIRERFGIAEFQIRPCGRPPTPSP